MDEQDAVTGRVRAVHLRRLSLGLALASMLGGVFYLYSNPQLVIMLSDQLWACF